MIVPATATTAFLALALLLTITLLEGNSGGVHGLEDASRSSELQLQPRSIIASWVENWSVDWCGPLLVAMGVAPIENIEDGDDAEGLRVDWVDRMVYVPYSLEVGAFPSSYLLSVRIYRLMGDSRDVQLLWTEAEQVELSRRCPVLSLSKEISSLQYVLNTFVQLSNDIDDKETNPASQLHWKYLTQLINETEQAINLFRDKFVDSTSNVETIDIFRAAIVDCIMWAKSHLNDATSSNDLDYYISNILNEFVSSLWTMHQSQPSTGVLEYIINIFLCMIEREFISEVRSIVWGSVTEPDDEFIQALATNILVRVVGVSPGVATNADDRRILTTTRTRVTNETLVVAEVDAIQNQDISFRLVPSTRYIYA
jgi:hypothetical protein